MCLASQIAIGVVLYLFNKREKINYLQIFADEQGESHFDSVELSSNELPSIPKAPSVHVSAGQPVDNLVFIRVPNG